ncbi:MAG: NADH:ubiquinone reductase (Na(+)-transporting) subunit C [Crocinitomicaceae bacterium]|jgi:Na+-transporting NADH:ubiquinone oxidoreductase subunit C|nr:NADH:ubiquinone reductase (Na(+)-transporting) subunit C [Crocinitomicaceae bacterium]MDP4865220.1 NADH:ubiquinone reductase (Na(+)-transporting) subunit C [Crocinitomicaceae bacterium]MDP5010501.1 NADH:ubiquinone reductase (Na(+)-transporting) subunit C [Crocinitomicaceae bacterium]MDP5098722.1 NADH:ubiquinone reductase (Na(+)-transporting) subunit C [Crocinitomicaceae bacterium]
MAINKDSNGYTFGFAIVLVIVVGTSLALLATGLKPAQEKNAEVKKKLEILSAMLDLEKEGITRKNAEEEFAKFVNLDEAIVLDMNGEVKSGIKAFDVDIRKENKDKKLKDSDKNYPLFIAKDKEGKTIYVIPIVGKGLWGPIWGNICIGEDMATIKGASFGHQGETPGLGAEIATPFFVNRWIGEKIVDDAGEFANFEIVKDGSGVNPQKVDGITGGTITSKGVEEMANRCLAVYASYFKKLK